MDHKRGNKSDNRWRKLRLASRSQNIRNSKLHKNSTTGVTGVRWHTKNKYYVARITYKGKYIHLGSSITLQGAIRLRRAAEKKYFGKFRYRHN